MLGKLPLLVVTLCLTIYWLTVIFKIVIQFIQIGKVANVIPREKQGRLIRILWMPIIFSWVALLWHATINYFPRSGFVYWLAWPAAVLVLFATVLTFYCWYEMGHSWRIGINPKETTQLVTGGPYQYVLHPIYSLSIVLAIGTMLILPTALIISLMLIHIVLVTYEAIREERYLITKHGQAYLKYKQKVGRFFPRLTTLKLICPAAK